MAFNLPLLNYPLLLFHLYDVLCVLLAGKDLALTMRAGGRYFHHYAVVDES